MNFLSNNKLLLFDYIEEIKFLFFIKIEVINYPLKKGKHLNEVKKKKAEEEKVLKEKKKTI